ARFRGVTLYIRTEGIQATSKIPDVRGARRDQCLFQFAQQKPGARDCCYDPTSVAGQGSRVAVRTRSVVATLFSLRTICRKRSCCCQPSVLGVKEQNER
ncbi:unnamed protein product, partial [Ectocarpus sp. 12 AP-2014]